MNQTIIQVFGSYFLCLDKFPLGWRFQWYIIHAYSMYEKGLLEVKTDQKRTILAKKSVFRTSGGKPDQSISSVQGWVGGSDQIWKIPLFFNPSLIPTGSSKIFENLRCNSAHQRLNLIWLTVGHVTRARWERRRGEWRRSVCSYLFNGGWAILLSKDYFALYLILGKQKIYIYLPGAPKKCFLRICSTIFLRSVFSGTPCICFK